MMLIQTIKKQIIYFIYIFQENKSFPSTVAYLNIENWLNYFLHKSYLYLSAHILLPTQKRSVVSNSALIISFFTFGMSTFALFCVCLHCFAVFLEITFSHSSSSFILLYNSYHYLLLQCFNCPKFLNFSTKCLCLNAQRQAKRQTGLVCRS